MTETKICGHCRAKKPLSDYAHHAYALDGRQRDCKQCQNERYRLSRQISKITMEQILATTYDVPKPLNGYVEIIAAKIIRNPEEMDEIKASLRFVNNVYTFNQIITKIKSWQKK